MSAATTWADVLRAQGDTVNPGLAYGCPSCGTAEHAFAIVQNDAGAWTCPACRAPALVDDRPALTWDDIRGQRRVFLEASDWSQLADVPAATRERWAPLRQRARDLTDFATPDEAQSALVALRADANP